MAISCETEMRKDTMQSRGKNKALWWLEKRHLMSLLPTQNTVSSTTQAAFIPFKFSYFTRQCGIWLSTTRLWKTAKKFNRLNAYLAMDFYGLN